MTESVSLQSISLIANIIEKMRHEEEPAEIERQDVDVSALAKIVSLSDVERLMCISGVNYPRARLMNSSEGLQRRRYFPTLDKATRLLNTSHALAEFIQNKSTIKLSNLEERLSQINALYIGLGKARRHVRGLALFVSPPDGRATIAHADDHANIIIQLSGQKTWRYWQRIDPSIISATESIQEIERRFEAISIRSSPNEIDLDAGDVIFVPSYLVHDAYTSDHHSLSISIQLLPREQRRNYSRPMESVGEIL